MIKEIRDKHQNVVVLDCGDSFSGKSNVPELRAEATIMGFNLLNYDGLNIADGELSLGLGFMEKLNEKAQFPFLSANIYRKKNDQPVGKEYLVKELNGFKVGIIGLTSPEFSEGNTLIEEELVIKDPESTIRKLLVEMKSQADVIILLSHLGKERTRELVKNVSGIDVAIIGHKLGVVHKVELADRTILVQSGRKGKHLGILNLTLDSKGSIIGHKARLAVLSKETPIDPTVQNLVRVFEAKKKASLRKDRLAKRRERELEEKAGGQLHMTPEQFIEEMQKEDRLLNPKEWKNKTNQ